MSDQTAADDRSNKTREEECKKDQSIEFTALSTIGSTKLVALNSESTGQAADHSEKRRKTRSTSSSKRCAKNDDREMILIDSDQESTISADSIEIYQQPNRPVSTSKNSTTSVAEGVNEAAAKLEIDYLYIGTYRFISRSYIGFSRDQLVLFINSGKEGLNIDYKLVRNIFICEAKSDNSKYTYMKIDFCSEAVDAINAYISKFNDENGNFKFESIVGHEKYFIMKLKFLLPEEALKLKKRLRIYLQHKLREELSIHSMFEQQRHYCLNLRSRKMCRTAVRRTNDQDKLSTSEIKSALRNRLRDEPMEVDRIHRNVPSMTTRSLSQLFSVSDRSTVSANERTQLKWKRPHKKLKFFKRPIICRTKRLVNCEQTTSTVQPTKNVTDTIEEKIINKSKVDSSIKSEENTNLISSNTSTQAVCARCSDFACNNQQVQIPNSNHNPIQLNRTSTIKISIINNTNSSLIGSMSMPATVGTDASLSVTPEITLKLMVVDETNGN